MSVNLPRGQLIDATQYQDAVARGVADPTGDALQKSETQQNKDLLTKFLTAVSEGRAGRDSVPATNLDQMKGYQGLANPGAVGQGTQLPMPFDEAYSATANILGVMNILGPAGYGQTEHLVKAVQSNHPLMKDALRQEWSLKEGVSTNYQKNRLFIALQRQREQSIYAMI